jgi:hypothetical protein
MALGQALSWKTYISAVGSYGIGRASRFVAVLLFAGEAVSAAGLLANPSSLEIPTAFLALGVTSLWGILAAYAFVKRRHVPNCACFGKFMSQELRWWVLLEDVAFVALAAWHLMNVL